MENNRVHGSEDKAGGGASFVPALRFKWATKLYDGLMQNFARDRVLRDMTVSAVTPLPLETILDFGCGTGSLTVALAQAGMGFSNTGFSVTGYDIDPEVLTLAEEKARRLSVRVMPSFRQADVTDIKSFPPTAKGNFDCVTSSLVFHHLNNSQKKKALKVAKDLMKPGGRFVLVDWGPGSNVFLKAAFWLVRLFDGFAVTRDNARGYLPAMIKEAGFTHIRARPALNTMFGTIWLFEAKK